MNFNKNMELNQIVIEVILIALSIISVAGIEYSETNEGYAQGLIPRCPNISKPAEIKQEHLGKLRISVLSKGGFLQAKWTPYTYHNVKALARNPEVDFRRKTVIYAPGYLESPAIPFGRLLMVLYRNMGYNVLLLEYVAFSTNVYPLVVRLAPAISKHIAEMIADLIKVGLNPDKLELVGLSLGGVMVSFIARAYRQITGRNITAITALDPAGPCVRHLGAGHRLDPSDADFVLHISTNSAGYGTNTPMGHVTVYINGGEYQPGMYLNYLCDNLCSHLQSLFIWMTALENPGAFIMVKCDSVQQAKDHDCFDNTPMVTNTFDLHMNRSEPGIYYLSTSNKYPFYLREKGIKKPGAVLNFISSLNDIEIMRI